MDTSQISKGHRQIIESLELDLKIACDGYPELRGITPWELCRRFFRASSADGRRISAAAAPVYCHELYLRHMTMAAPSLPTRKVSQLLSRNFGSSDNFFYLVRTLAGSTNSPGFLWVYAKVSRKKPEIGIARLPLCTLPDLAKIKPIFCIDLWEHAYMDKFGTDTGAFADSYLRHLDWEGAFGEFCT